MKELNIEVKISLCSKQELDEADVFAVTVFKITNFKKLLPDILYEEILEFCENVYPTFEYVDFEIISYS